LWGFLFFWDKLIYITHGGPEHFGSSSPLISASQVARTTGTALLCG
jgi:hypothetical protein